MTFIPASKSLASTSVGVAKNRMLNGDMRIDQQNGGNLVSVTSVNRSVDQIIGQVAGGGIFSLQRQTATPPTGFTHYLRASCTTADVSIAAGDLYRIFMRLEGNNVRDFLWGTASTKAITVSFWARSSLTGTYTGSVRNPAANSSYSFEYTVNVADTWEKKIITLPGDTIGVMNTDTVTGTEISWTFALGSSQQGTANVWGTPTAYGTANQVNWMSSNSSRTYDITGIQVEVGTTATSFEYRPFQIELALCQRYYEKSYDLETSPGTSTALGLNRITPVYIVASEVDVTINFKVSKRAIPTMLFWTQAGVASQWGWWSILTATRTDHSMSGNPISTNSTIGFWVGGTTDDRAGADGHWVADARL